MPFDNTLSQDAAIQQGAEYLELWESTRYRQDHPQQQLNQDHVQNYHRDVNVQNHELNQAAMPEVAENPHHLGNSQQDHYTLEPQRAPTWLSTALSQQNPAAGNQNTNIEACPVCSSRGPCMCNASMHGTDAGASSSTFLDQSAYTQWLGAGIGSSSQFEQAGKEDDLQFGINRQQARMATELNLSAAHGRENAPQGTPFLEQQPDLGQQSGAGGVPRYAGEPSRADWDTARQEPDWEEVRKRCLIINHPLYPEMLAKHVECLRVGTPVDQLPSIEAQLAQAPNVTEKYRALSSQMAEITPEEQADLDQFMTEYPIMLGTFKELLQNHVYSDVTEAMMSCWELEQALLGLTGVRLEEGCGATMSDDDVEEYDSDYGSFEQGMDYNDSGGFGPLVPSETERTLMERVRQELKHELKQGYKSKIEDVREEILRKRRAGKLPEGTTTVLKAWWQAHSKWPYPTEDEKELLIQETGLELKQVNNWFINQRKRNWHSNPLVNTPQASDPKNKVRKSW